MANAPGDASRVTTAEPNRTDAPSRWHALRNTDASPLRGACIVHSWANNPGDASHVTIAEPNRAGVPSRWRALRNTDASPLRGACSVHFQLRSTMTIDDRR